MTSTKAHPPNNSSTPPIPQFNTPRHARAVPDDPNNPRFHMAMCGAGYPWPSSISLEPRPENLARHPEDAFKFPVTCRACVEAIERRHQPANPIPLNSSDH